MRTLSSLGGARPLLRDFEAVNPMVDDSTTFFPFSLLSTTPSSPLSATISMSSPFYCCVSRSTYDLAKLPMAISLPITMANSSYISILLFKNSACLQCACKGERNVENSIFTSIIKIDPYRFNIHSYNQYLLT